MREFLFRLNVIVSGLIFMAFCAFAYINMRPEPFGGWEGTGWIIAMLISAGIVSVSIFGALCFVIWTATAE